MAILTPMNCAHEYWPLPASRILYFFHDYEEKLTNMFQLDKLRLTFYNYYSAYFIPLLLSNRKHPVLTENTLIITVLSNRSRKRYFPVGSVFIKACARAYICIVKQELL
jgi:hypothetical protein